MTNPPHGEQQGVPPSDADRPPTPSYVRPPVPGTGTPPVQQRQPVQQPQPVQEPPLAGQPGFGQPGHGPSGYAPQPYGQQPYGQAPGYGQPQQYGTSQQYGPPPFGTPPQYGAPQYPAPGQYGQPYGAPPQKSKVGLIAAVTGVVLLAIVGVVVLVLALQSKVLDRAAVERDVAAQFEEREGVAIDLSCTDEMQVDAGSTYECSGTTADGEDVTLRIRIEDEDSAAYTWTEP
ncbi:MAG TPA: DUF4333 domain-containing protein [Blastococcus sp.]|nr:DUF4333 domain-containing protein [Blastococcus sp.]